MQVLLARTAIVAAVAAAAAMVLLGAVLAGVANAIWPDALSRFGDDPWTMKSVRFIIFIRLLTYMPFMLFIPFILPMPFISQL